MAEGVEMREEGTKGQREEGKKMQSVSTQIRDGGDTTIFQIYATRKHPPFFLAPFLP
jgi:hypothetical protein